MQPLLSIVGSVAGLAGVLACLAGGVTRASGSHYLAGLEVESWFQLGIALLASACWAKLESVERLP